MAQPNPALEAAAQAMLAPVKTNAAASAREALSRKCRRFAPSSEPILPMMSPLYWARRMVENVPHQAIVGADGEVVAYSVEASVSAAQARAA